MAKLTLRQLQSQISSSPTASWRAGATPISALSEAEQDRRLGLIVHEENKRRIEEMLRRPQARAFSFAPASDWRNKNGQRWTTDIRDQGQCGSCVAFATVATLEAQARIQLNTPDFAIDLSEADLFFCGAGKACDTGWQPSEAMAFAKASGIGEESCFPYQDHDMDCQTCTERPAHLLQVTEYEEVVDIGARKEFLDTVGPMVAAMAVYRDFFYYQSGIYRHVSGDLAGYHAISCVGYSETDQCWICKNSWGPSFGENGYFRIGYGESEIDTSFGMFGARKVAGTLLDGAVTETGDDWAEMVFAEHAFKSNKNLIWAYVKGKWRYQEVTEEELAGLGGTLFEAASVRAFYTGEKLDKLVGAKKY